MYIYIKELKRDEELINNVDMPNILKKIIIKIKKIFNIITIKKIDKLHYLYVIPNIKNIKVIEKIIKKNMNCKIILEKKLKIYEKELKLKKENKIIYYFIYDILKYITNIKNVEIEFQNIYLLSNEYNLQNLEIIKYLIDKVKSVNIITNNLNNYKKLEEKMYDEGNLITITNNKNKGLKRAKYIINLDFDNEVISKYKINRDSIIINCNNSKINVLKYFEGIIINNIEIKIEEKEELQMFYKEFDKVDIYESFEIKSVKYLENITKIKEDKLKIVNVIGNNGVINTKEIANM